MKSATVEASVASGAGALGGQGHELDHSQDRLTGNICSLIEEAKEFGGNKTAPKRSVMEWLGRHFSEENSERNYERYANELGRVRYQELPRLVETYVPETMIKGKPLAHWKRPKKPQGIDPALVLNSLLTSRDPVEQFEGKRDLSLAYLFLWMITDREQFGLANAQELDLADKSERGQRRAYYFLKKHGVIRDIERNVQLRTLHNGEDHYRCVGIKLPDGLWFLEPKTEGPWLERCTTQADLVTLDCRSGPIRALLVIRRKGFMQTIAKMFLRNLANPLAVADRRGVRFGFRTKEDLDASADYVRTKLSNGMGWKERGSEEDSLINPHAASNLIMSKDTAKYGQYWEIEIQYLLARQHVDLLFTTGEENSLLYHLRQYSDPQGLFPQIWPQEHYKIPWGESAVANEAKAAIQASLKWESKAGQRRTF